MTRTITKEVFETEVRNKYVVHIAGKGNMPTEGEDSRDMSQYTMYMKNYGWYKSFEKQAIVYYDLNAHVTPDFHNIIYKLDRSLKERANSATQPEMVFTFDGDNYQDNSPFTKGIKQLIDYDLPVYAFKAKPPGPKHFESWEEKANEKKVSKKTYTALVDLHGIPPKDYTRHRCDAYVSYGYPKLVSIYQPQKDTEINEDGSDEFHRVRPDEFEQPGLVLSSMSSELSMDFIREFGDTHKPESQRFFMLYNRQRRTAGW